MVTLTRNDEPINNYNYDGNSIQFGFIIGMGYRSYLRSYIKPFLLKPMSQQSGTKQTVWPVLSFWPNLYFYLRIFWILIGKPFVITDLPCATLATTEIITTIATRYIC